MVLNFEVLGAFQKKTLKLFSCITELPIINIGLDQPSLPLQGGELYLFSQLHLVISVSCLEYQYQRPLTIKG